MTKKYRRQVPFTDEQLRATFYVDTSEWIVRRKIASPPYEAGHRANARCRKSGYRFVRIRTKEYAEHRLIWFLYYGRWPKYHIDHINGDKLDNRIENLRDVPAAINAMNVRKAREGTRMNTPLGVVYIPAKKAKTPKYRATISINGVAKSLGKYHTPEEAHQVYLEAKRRLHSGCTI